MVLCLSILSIAALVCSCILLDNLVPEEYSDALEWVADIWTWFHVSSRDVMIIFIAYIFFGRFKNVRLADNQDEKPEFSTMTMFAMALVAGVSSQMFYYAVSDPISHYDPKDGSNRYLADPHIADNTLAQIAIKLTFFHYGERKLWPLVSMVSIKKTFFFNFPLRILSVFIGALTEVFNQIKNKINLQVNFCRKNFPEKILLILFFDYEDHKILRLLLLINPPPLPSPHSKLCSSQCTYFVGRAIWWKKKTNHYFL